MIGYYGEKLSEHASSARFVQTLCTKNATAGAVARSLGPSPAASGFVGGVVAAEIGGGAGVLHHAGMLAGARRRRVAGRGPALHPRGAQGGAGRIFAGRHREIVAESEFALMKRVCGHDVLLWL